MSRLAVAIAVGGSSSRIGGAKPLLRLGEKTLLDWAIEYAYGVCEEVYLLTRGNRHLNDLGFLKESAEIILDADLCTFPDRIAASLRKIPSELVFLMGCDMPFLDPSLPRFLESSIGLHGAAVPAWGNGYIEPLAALYLVSRVPEPRCFMSMRDLCKAMDPALVDVDPPFPKWTFFNINTRGDLLMAESMLRSFLRRRSSCGR